jgi:hypothetical protein
MLDFYVMSGRDICPRCSRKSGVYASKLYSHDDYKYLKILGVVEMSFESFLTDPKMLLAETFEKYTQKPAVWHAALAGVLN